MRSEYGELLSAAGKLRKQSVPIQRKLILYLLGLTAAAFSVALLLLSLAGVLPASAKRAGELLTRRQEAAAAFSEQKASLLMARCIRLSEEASEILNGTLSTAGKSFSALSDNPALITEIEYKLFFPLKGLLDANLCSGVFAVLDATVNTRAENAENSRMGVYLRLTDLHSVNSVRQNIRYFRGAKEVARAEHMEMHNRWNLEFDISHLPGYKKLLSCAGRPADNCFWSDAVLIKSTWENAVMLSVPIFDSAGRVRGVCGADITELYYRLSFPAFASPIGTVVTLLSPVSADTLMLDSALFGGTDGSCTDAGGALKIKEDRYFNLYSSSGSSVFIGTHSLLPLRTVSGSPLVLCSLLSKTQYDGFASAERVSWICGTAGIFVFMLLLCFFMAHRFVKPVRESLDSLKKSGDPAEGLHSGISEFDMLYELLKDKNALSGELPPRVCALLDSFAEKLEGLTPMERLILQCHIDGLTTEEIAADNFVSYNTVRKHNSNIHHKLGLSHDELMLYIDLFRRCGRLDRISRSAAGADETRPPLPDG